MYKREECHKGNQSTCSDVNKLFIFLGIYHLAITRNISYLICVLHNLYVYVFKRTSNYCDKKKLDVEEKQLGTSKTLPESVKNVRQTEKQQNKIIEVII